MTDVELKRLQAICEVAGVDDIGELSDGFHTFNSLYEQRMILFAALVKVYKDKAWKSLRHEDGELCFGGDWFIVGIDTPKGSYTYHYDIKYWDVFDCRILKTAKHWDGHTEKDVTRLLSLPSAEPNLQPTCNNLATDTISRQAAIDALDKQFWRFLNIPICKEIRNVAQETIKALPSVQPEWNNHTVACLLAELFSDNCACNFNGIDEWLPEKCEVIDACPNPVGVACWEQYLMHRAERRADD